MPLSERLVDPWLIAAWPGMGNVALGAAAYLVEKLGAKKLTELTAAEYFDVKGVQVKNGLCRAARLPTSVFYGWKNPRGGRDLLLFVGESQPSDRGYEFCRRVLEIALGFGVRRILTFAAMATPIHPAKSPRVFGVATDAALLERVKREKVQPLGEGEVTGLNGVLLAATGEYGLDGVCLLGELPFFAIGVPNPKASLAVLKVFARLFDVPLDFTEMAAQASAVEAGLIRLLDRLNQAAQEAGADRAESELGFSVPDFSALHNEEVGADHEAAAGDSDEQSGSQLREQDRRRIDKLFRAAHDDRTRALELKHELDRLNVFGEYEDRFLDLFKRGE